MDYTGFDWIDSVLSREVKRDSESSSESQTGSGVELAKDGSHIVISMALPLEALDTDEKRQAFFEHVRRWIQDNLPGS